MVCLLQFGMIKGSPGRVPPVPAQRSQWEHNVVSNSPNEALSTFSHRRHRKMTAIVSNRTTAKGGNWWDIHHCRFGNQNNEKRIRFVSHATHRKAKRINEFWPETARILSQCERPLWMNGHAIERPTTLRTIVTRSYTRAVYWQTSRLCDVSGLSSQSASWDGAKHSKLQYHSNWQNNPCSEEGIVKSDDSDEYITVLLRRSSNSLST